MTSNYWNDRPPLRVGDCVRLDVPENPRLHRQDAVVVATAEWGAHTWCPAAATGNFRAAWDEMRRDGGDDGAAGMPDRGDARAPR